MAERRPYSRLILLLIASLLAGCSPKGPTSTGDDVPQLTASATPHPGGTSATPCDDEDGCSPVDVSAGQEETTGKPPSAKAKAMTADKRLTREEYETAFADFQACLAESGLELTGVSTSGTYITYSTGPGDAWDDCYDVHYMEADSFWQVYEHPRSDLTAPLEAKIACLEGPKIDHPPWKVDVPRRDQAFLYDEIDEFIAGVEEAGQLTKAEAEACWSAGAQS